MKQFTRITDTYRKRLINNKIADDLETITTSVRALLGDRLHSLLLCGGFGRGEGSVVVKDTTVRIINDYDFTVVLNTSNRLQYLRYYRDIKGPMEQLAGELAEELGIKQVDLSPKPLSYFTGKQALKIENYDIKNGHILVYGQENPTDWMPAWKPEDIPLFEGTWFFRNRGVGLILAALYFMTDKRIPQEKKENFIIECTKAQLAMGDGVLLMNRTYHHLYHSRLTIAEKIDMSDIPNRDDIRRRYLESLTQKLYPDFDRYLERDLTSWWFDVTRAFESFFRWYEQQRLGLAFERWTDYAVLPRTLQQPELKTFAGKIFRSRAGGLSLEKLHHYYRSSSPGHSISLVALVLFSMNREGFDIPMMEAAAKLLDTNLTDNPKLDWIRLARGVLAEIHPGGEAGRVLENKKPITYLAFNRFLHHTDFD